jgi:hypothetical protein
MQKKPSSATFTNLFKKNVTEEELNVRVRNAKEQFQQQKS